MTEPKQRLNPVAARRMQSAAEALQTGQAARAEQHLAYLSKSCPDHPEFLRLAAILYDMRGMRREATATMRQALALCPDDAVYYNTMAGVLDHAYEFDAAIEASRSAVELDPGSAIAWYNLGVELTHVCRALRGGGCRSATGGETQT